MPKQEYDSERLRRTMELGEKLPKGDINTVLTNWKNAERIGEGNEFLNSLTSEQLDAVVGYTDLSEQQKEKLNEYFSIEYELLAKEAREVFKEHFFGIAEVEEAFTLKDGTKLVEFSLSQKREIIKNLNKKLNEPDIKTFLSKLKQRRQHQRGLFHNNTIDQYRNEPFFTQDTPNPMEWKLSTKEILEETEEHDYLEQTQILIDTLKQNFPENQIPPEYKEAIQEFETRRESLQKLLQTNWLQAGRELVNLKITQLLRRSPIEMIYDGLVVLRNAKQRISVLNGYDHSNKLHSVGGVVYCRFFADFVIVGNCDPSDFGYNENGSSFSR